MPSVPHFGIWLGPLTKLVRRPARRDRGEDAKRPKVIKHEIIGKSADPAERCAALLLGVWRCPPTVWGEHGSPPRDQVTKGNKRAVDTGATVA